jgi:YfiH family protein
MPTLNKYNISDQVIAFSTTRRGGESEGNYGEFNINAFCGDLPEHVAQNKKALAQELNIDETRIVMPHQVHDVESRMIADEFFTLPAAVQTMIVDKVDALMSDQKNVCIGVSTADCIPVLLYDETHHAIAAIHAGWRGTLNRIAHKTVVEMNRCYGTMAGEVKAVIGPGISLDNFEVGQEVYDQFAQVGFDMGKIAKMYEKWHIDLPGCNRMQLEEAGVKSENIQMSGICTYTHADEYFSARRLGQNSGRIFTGILLK